MWPMYGNHSVLFLDSIHCDDECTKDFDKTTDFEYKHHKATPIKWQYVCFLSSFYLFISL